MVFGKIGKKIGDVAGSAADMAKDAAEKAKDMAEISKLNSIIASEEKKIQQYYLEIGEKIFKQDKENPDSPVAELCSKVLAAQQIIEKIKQDIIEIKED